MAKVPYGVEALRKISVVRVLRYRQTTDRRTDGRMTTYSERLLKQCSFFASHCGCLLANQEVMYVIVLVNVW